MTDRSALPGNGVRRRAVITTAVAGTALGACSVPAPRRPDPTPDPAPGMPVSTARRALLMQILAHPDDDLYFMNPDTRRALDAGTPLVCVYLTAGEADGLNRVPGRPRPAPDKAAYSSARHQGLRQAYATLLGLEKFTPWEISVAELADGHRAEVDTLAAGGRRVELVFIDTATHTTRHRLGLPSLWHDRRLTLRTVVAEGSPLDRPGTYTYDGLVDVLVGLFELHRPTLVHTLDPDPDIQHSSEAARRRDSEQSGYSDHADHTAAACFAWAAMIRWVAASTRGGGRVPGFAVASFRGYYNRHWPKNLPPALLTEKAGHLVPYGGSPDWDCGNPSGCGDYNVGGDRPLTNRKGWVRSTRHRYPGARTVVAAGPDGRLDAYAVVGLRLVRWRETEPAGGVWGPPGDLGGGPLAPALGSATAEDGILLLFGLRFAALRGQGSDDEREVALLEQTAPGGGFLAWRGLGNPSPGRDDGRRIGVPVAVAAPDGRVHLFVRNAEKGVSTRVREADRTWGKWRDMGGGEVQDGLSAVVDRAGRVHVHAAGHHAVHHWTQDAPGSELTARTQIDAGPVPGDAPAGLPAADGSVDVFYRGQARAVTTAVRDGVASDLVGFDGYGELTAVGASLLGRTVEGGLQVLTGTRLSQRTRGSAALDGAALRLGDDGRPVVVGLGPDALPFTWRP
ncbi:PIG-L family deacetylase [[Kitasatospora] papulosa]|uniref:PIG-L family deacetylase n=2 Tax=Streptomyces TaxID=1883 RepID=UPI0036AF5363